MKTRREESRQDWDAEQTNESINMGSLQRIADACELMAKDRQRLEADFAYMRTSRDRFRSEYEVVQRSNAALRGVITKLKKKIKALEDKQ